MLCSYKFNIASILKILQILNFNKRQYKKQKWMTDEILALIVLKNKMFVDWKTTLVTHTDYKTVKLRFIYFIEYHTQWYTNHD